MEADQTVNINDGNSQNFFFFTPSQLRLEQSGLFIYKSAPHCLNILTHCEEDLFSLNFFFVEASSFAYATSPQYIYCM